jgi:LacI family transcriptional regulator
MKKITIKDIAIEARVSISTVSFVLNNKGVKMGISESRIEKVKEVAERLGYRPNMIASSLRTGKTRSIGLIVEDISNQFFSDLARVIEDEAKKIGYRVFYCSTGNDDDRSDELIQSLLQANVDGFIITPTEQMEKSIDYLTKLRMPLVLIDRYFLNQNVSHVVVDNYDGAYNAADFLVKKGFKNIALVSNTSKMIQMQLREKGYVDVLTKAGFYDESLVLRLEYHSSEEQKINEIICFFQKNPKIDAVLFLANYMGLAGLQAFRKMGVKIPQDVAVISFDDHDSFRMHTPSISVIEQPIGDIAIKAVEILMSQMTETKPFETEKMSIKSRLVVRESV